MGFRISSDYTPQVKMRKIRDQRYLKLIRQCPCVINNNHLNIEAAHIRFADVPGYNKPFTGGGQKPEDNWVLPLSKEMHNMGPQAQHNVGDEEDWWQGHGFDPLALCVSLYDDGEYKLENMLQTIRKHHKQWERL